MTDRSSEERSRTWTPLVEVIRLEMMARFSDKLSMEEIASCAYAVAALEDRQEAANSWRDGFIAGQEHMKFRATQLPAPPLDKYDIPRSAHDKCMLAILNLPIETTASCVPSEATPSKENAPQNGEEHVK